MHKVILVIAALTLTSCTLKEIPVDEMSIATDVKSEKDRSLTGKSNVFTLPQDAQEFMDKYSTKHTTFPQNPTNFASEVLNSVGIFDSDNPHYGEVPVGTIGGQAYYIPDHPLYGEFVINAYPWSGVWTYVIYSKSFDQNPFDNNWTGQGGKYYYLTGRPFTGWDFNNALSTYFLNIEPNLTNNDCTGVRQNDAYRIKVNLNGIKRVGEKLEVKLYVADMIRSIDALSFEKRGDDGTWSPWLFSNNLNQFIVGVRDQQGNLVGGNCDSNNTTQIVFSDYWNYPRYQGNIFANPVIPTAYDTLREAGTFSILLGYRDGQPVRYIFDVLPQE